MAQVPQSIIRFATDANPRISDRLRSISFLSLFAITCCLPGIVSAQDTIIDGTIESEALNAVPPSEAAHLPTLPVGADSGLWQWTPLAPHHQSIVEVSCNGGIGTGVVIEIDKDKRIKNGHEGYVLTAWHVVEEDAGEGKIKVRYKNGIGSKKCRIVHADEQKDIALLWVWVPDEIPAATLGTDTIESGHKLEFAGLGGGSNLKCCIRHFSATASSPSSLEKIFADVPLLPGDSGGPVFNEKQEVVGIISGGWFWFNSGLTNESGASIRTTWPARASNIGPIQSLMAKLNDPADTTVK